VPVAAALTEIVEPSGRGRLFELPVSSRLADATPSGRVRLDAIAGWLQDVARADVDDALDGEEWLWIVRRTRIRATGFPRWGEACTARTWCSGTGSMWAERRTSITGDRASVEAVGLWVRIDEERGRPVPPGEACVRVFEPSAQGRHVKARLRHPGPPPHAARSSWRFRATELDMAAHVNNAAYWAIVEDELAAGPEPASFDGEIEFRAGAQAGEATVLSDADRRWVLGSDGELSASILLSVCARPAGAGTIARV
jgi:acyl-ACP thioesterase